MTELQLLRASEDSRDDLWARTVRLSAWLTEAEEARTDLAKRLAQTTKRLHEIRSEKSSGELLRQAGYLPEPESLGYAAIYKRRQPGRDTYIYIHRDGTCYKVQLDKKTLRTTVEPMTAEEIRALARRLEEQDG